MLKTKQSLSELWMLLRNKEKQYGLDILSLTDREILLNIIQILGNNKQISLDNVMKNCPHPRATLFRCLKKLRAKNLVKVIKDNNDGRKSFLQVTSKLCL